MSTAVLSGYCLAAMKMVVDRQLLMRAEPQTVTVDGNVTDIGPAVEPVPDNGRRDENREPQQTLFSWAEFMNEGP